MSGSCDKSAVVSGLIYTFSDRCECICWLGFTSRKAVNMFNRNMRFWEGTHVSDDLSSIRISSTDSEGIFWKASQVKKYSMKEERMLAMLVFHPSSSVSSSSFSSCSFYFPGTTQDFNKVLFKLASKAEFSFQAQPSFFQLL